MFLAHAMMWNLVSLRKEGASLVHYVFMCRVNYFFSSNIATDNVTHLSLKLQAFIQINLANHIMFSPAVTFCLPLLTPLTLTTPPTTLFQSCFHISPPTDHLPVSRLIDGPFALHHFSF